MTTTIEDRTTKTKKDEGLPCRDFYINNEQMQLAPYGYPLVGIAPMHQIQLRFEGDCAVLSVPLALDLDDVGDILGHQIGDYLKNPRDYELFEPAANRFQELINEAMKVSWLR